MPSKKKTIFVKVLERRGYYDSQNKFLLNALNKNFKMGDFHEVPNSTYFFDQIRWGKLLLKGQEKVEETEVAVIVEAEAEVEAKPKPKAKSETKPKKGGS